ncbi:serine/threonine protein kinase [Pleurocapsa sp. PCC 7327]|uniref:protein kinase domain-containing protein n=1 Tax=Pleurocapsa sp. PCC 7327 TaxID=118163 RepID=UPI00029FD6C8|nr:protein kinase [Pleurocapsa sp. PCC 7327]AFY77371.1 serine/threonine protein kinase [Pleurocapsa sp. PCC 7327]
MVDLLKNRYRILCSLSRGGFGETFLAEDTDMPSARRCVIKKLIPIANDPQIYQLVKERFQREGIILEKLGEGNSQIPSLYAYFEESGQFYLVQEWIKGTTLSEKVRQEGKLNEGVVKEILISILSVLDYIHTQHIVHRDIKPDNIIIRASDNKPFLIDFGAVKETMGTVMTTSGHSTYSIAIGTPGFMPSEQIAGRPVYASDLYSLALTAIYLLSGKYPQEFATNPATGEILWRQHALSTSSALATILDKAIQPHPRDRFLSAKEMLAAIKNEVRAIPTSAPSASPTGVSTAVISPARGNSNSRVTNTNSGGLKDWQKATIVGSIIGSFVMGASMVNSYFSRQSELQISASNSLNNSEVQPQEHNTPEINTSPIVQPTQPSESETVNSPAAQPTQPSESETVNSPSVQSPNDRNENSKTGNLSPKPSSSDRNENLTNAIEESQAAQFVEKLYALLSDKKFDEARLAYGPPLAAQFDPNFFTQFERVTVENLQIISRTDSSINLIGENTYFYPDGSTQREQRTYTVRNLNGKLKITNSKFVKVTKFRQN